MLLKLARFCLYLVPFVVTLVATTTFFPFIGIKYYAFRVLISLALALFMASWAFERTPRNLGATLRQAFRNPIVIATTVFAAIFVLASLTAFDPAAAFWSNFERGEGGLQMLHYYFFFILAVLLFTERVHWRTFFTTSIVAAVIMVGYGVLSIIDPQSFLGGYGGLETVGFWGRLFSPTARFQGSLGNAAYVAPYLMFILFYLLWLWRDAQRHILSSIGYAVLGLLGIFFFVLAQTRGALLGTVAALGVFLLYVIYSRPVLRKKATGVLVALAILFGIGLYFRHEPIVSRIPGGRLLQISLNERTAQLRFWAWRIALEGFVERPVLGWGPENFPVVFDKHFDHRYFIAGQGGETWFDRAHSVVFDYLVETGILGLLAYLAMLLAIPYQFLRHNRIGTALQRHQEHAVTLHPLTTVQEGLLFAIVTGYFVQGLLLFDVLPIFFNFIAVLAFASFVFSTTKHHARTS